MAHNARMNRGAIALRKWLEDERKRRSQADDPVTDKWFGAQVGVHQTTVGGWKRGTRIQLAHAREVERVTGIPVAWWDEPARKVPSSPPTHKAV